MVPKNSNQECQCQAGDKWADTMPKRISSPYRAILTEESIHAISFISTTMQAQLKLAYFLISMSL